MATKLTGKMIKVHAYVFDVTMWSDSAQKEWTATFILPHADFRTDARANENRAMIILSDSVNGGQRFITAKEGKIMPHGKPTRRQHRTETVMIDSAFWKYLVPKDSNVPCPAA